MTSVVPNTSPRTVAPGALLGLLALLVMLATGCWNVRGPNSRIVPPPYDPEREAVADRVTSLIQNPEIKISQRQAYYIGPGDQLGITLVGRPDILSNDRERGERFQVNVTENPLITLPLVGAIRVHGKTAQELEEELKAAYSKFISNPVPVVTIEKYYFNSVTVLGSVKNPGRYPLEFGDTVLDSIFKAGGLTFGRDTGNLPPARYLKVYREKVNNKERFELNPEQLIERFREDDQTIMPREEIIVPIEQFILNGDLKYNIPLEPNDIVYIPAAGTVIVHGRAKNPGVKFMGPSLRTLAAVITEAGSLRYSAASRVEVVRTYPDGSQESFFLNARKIRRRTQEDFMMQDGDQVFIYTLPTRDVLEFFGNIFRAGADAGVSATYAPI